MISVTILRPIEPTGEIYPLMKLGVLTLDNRKHYTYIISQKYCTPEFFKSFEGKYIFLEMEKARNPLGLVKYQVIEVE